MEHERRLADASEPRDFAVTMATLSMDAVSNRNNAGGDSSQGWWWKNQSNGWFLEPETSELLAPARPPWRHPRLALAA